MPATMVKALAWLLRSAKANGCTKLHTIYRYLFFPYVREYLASAAAPFSAPSCRGFFRLGCCPFSAAVILDVNTDILWS